MFKNLLIFISGCVLGSLLTGYVLINHLNVSSHYHWINTYIGQLNSAKLLLLIESKDKRDCVLGNLILASTEELKILRQALEQSGFSEETLLYTKLIDETLKGSNELPRLQC
ncbi:MAG: hypothetical protein ACPGR2_04740 [Psychrobium sp.]